MWYFFTIYWSHAVPYARKAGQKRERTHTDRREVTMTRKHIETGERLRHYREACALSQQQVANALNIERSTYTRYETGETEPGLSAIVKLSAIYNVSPTQLLPMEEADDEPVRKLKDTVQSDSPIYQLSKDERGLIALYRALNKGEKKQAHELIIKLRRD